jgi:hypothetical protein
MLSTSLPFLAPSLGAITHSRWQRAMLTTLAATSRIPMLGGGVTERLEISGESGPDMQLVFCG